MADDPTKHAIEVVAHYVVATGRTDEDNAWGLYPEIGEFDWLVIQARADEIAASLMPHELAFDAAYEHLMQRAEGADA